MEYGVICLLPILVVIILAVISKRAFEPLAIASVVGYFLLNDWNPAKSFSAWLEAFTGVIADNAWYWLVFFLFGSVVALITRCGGAQGLTNFGARYANTRAKALIITWVLGVAIFIDDFLNNLVIGTAMKGIADKLGISRHMLAYVINSTGACVCVLVPISTWAIFMQGLFEEQGITVNGTGLGAYTHAIPYMFYPIAVVILAWLYILNVVKPFGPIRKQEKLAAEAAARLAADTRSDEARFNARQAIVERVELYMASQAEDEIQKEKMIEALHKAMKEVKPTNPLNFIIPLIVITGVTIYTGDMLTGIIIGLVSMFIMYIPQKLMTIGEYFDGLLEGMFDMMVINALVASYFCLQTANDKLGVAEYVIDSVSGLMNAHTLPLIAFIVVSLLAFVTGSFWGMPAIAFPIMIPLAQMYGNDPLVIGAAIVSGGAFGSSACFYGDAVTLVCAATDIKNYEYLKCVVPLLVLPCAVAVLIYVIYGVAFI